MAKGPGVQGYFVPGASKYTNMFQCFGYLVITGESVLLDVEGY